MKTYITFILILLGITSNQVCGQNPQRSMSDYELQVEKMNLKKPADYYYKKKINLWRAEELKAVGLNIKSLDETVGVLKYQEYALISNVIVVGTIISKEYDSDKKSYFHTTYTIKVETVNKGFNIPSTIYVKLVSGLSGNSYKNSNDEPEMHIGEKAIFFLDNIPFGEMAEAQAKGFLPYNINVNEAHRSSTFILNRKYTVREGNIFEYQNQKIESLDVALEVIQKIVNINQSNN